MSHVPIRMCVICRQRFSKNLLTRYTVNAQAKLVDDLGQDGRGWYVCKHAVCIEKFSFYKPKLTMQKRGTKRV